MFEMLFFFDKLLLAKIIELMTPYKIFLGGTAAYLFVYSYYEMMKSKKKGEK